jgi:hypothetical protein
MICEFAGEIRISIAWFSLKWATLDALWDPAECRRGVFGLWVVAFGPLLAGARGVWGSGG